jgi:hypothetical protein
VLVGFIHDINAFGGESRRQLLCDQIAGRHSPGYGNPCPAVNPVKTTRQINTGEKMRKRSCQVLKVSFSGAHTVRS